MANIDIEENKRIATDFYNAFGIEKDADKCARFLCGEYTQHNPNIQDGPGCFLRFVRFRKEKYPEARNEIKMTIAEGDKVLFHVHSVLTPGEAGRSLVDIFRVTNGKVMEHWDVVQDVPVLKYPPANDNGTFNEQGDSILADPGMTEENKRIATEFYKAYAIEMDADKCGKFLGNRFLQHDPFAPDGPDYVMKYVDFRKKHYPDAVSEVKMSLAQGNLIGFYTHSILNPGEPGCLVADIFRVENGLIAECWNNVQNIGVQKYPPLNDNWFF